VFGPILLYYACTCSSNLVIQSPVKIFNIRRRENYVTWTLATTISGRMEVKRWVRV